MFNARLLSLIETGVRSHHTDRERRRIEAINLFNILCASIGALYALFFLWQGADIRSVPGLIFAVLSFTLISFLQHRQHHNIAIILLNINCGLAATLMTYIHGWWSGFPLCFLVTPLMIAVFQDLKRNWVTFGVGFYYFTMICFSYALHYFGYEMVCTNAEVIFPINFVAVLLLILALSFYLWRIYDDYSQQVDNTNAALIQKNEELEFKNQDIQGLVGMLHDKVKNNLQTLYLFGEMDRFAKLDIPTDLYMRLSRSRIKVIDICYQLEYELEMPPKRWLKRFLRQYPKYLEQHFGDFLLPGTVFSADLKDTHYLRLSRKRFETTMLLFNELCNFIIHQANEKIGENIHIQTVKCDKNEDEFVLGFSIKNYPHKPMFNPFFMRFLKEQKVKLHTVYDENSRFLSINMILKTEK
jgi:hypothetical protein